jgi:hypothetical protein
MDHSEYLKRILATKKIELENVNIEHRIIIAEYKTKKELLQELIDSLEKQLSS